MSTAVASRVLGRTIASQGFTRCSRPQYAGIRARNQEFRIARSFTAGARASEKKYTQDHEWVELGSDGKTGTIGISEYAAKALGDVVYVELPEVGIEVSQGDSIGAVESVKSASDIMTPVSGKITDANNALEEKPATINKSPEADGWLAKIEVSDAAEIEALMNADGYKKFTEEADDDH